MLEEIVVTAQKRAQRLIDVPMSITALDGRALQQAGIGTMLALSYAVPSLVVQQTGGGYQRYFIRGIGNGNSPISLVGVYVDDADITNNGNTQLDFQPTDLQRIEVLKGPQGTLYGDGSAGGTIRFITNDPDLKHYSATGDFETYATQYGSPSQELTAIVNAPLAKNVFGLRMVGTAADLGGWIDQPATGRTNINDQNLSDVRLKALWMPARAATVKALVDIHRNHGNGTDSGADANYVLTLAVDPTARTPFESNFDLYNLTAAYDFRSVRVLSSTTHFNTATRGVVGLEYPVAYPPVPLSQFLNNPDTRNDRSFSEEIRVSSRGANRFHWVAGAFYKNLILNYVTYYAYSGGGGSPGSGIAIDDEGSKSTSLFGDGGYKVTHALEIGGGVRFFHDDRTEYDGVLYRTGSFHSVDPRLYASYILSKGFHVYVNAADGFRSGGFNGGYGLPESTFAPEKVRSYEAGTKISMLGGRLAADAALFFSNYDNIQIYVNTPNGIGLLQNGGDAHIWGGDWSLEWQATDRLLFAFSGSATESKMMRLLPGVAVAKVGDPVDMTTDYTARLSGTYHFDIGQYLPGFFRLDYTDIGPSHLTDRGEGGPPILFRTAIMHMLDARIGVQRGEWEVDLFATNLLNANGIQDGDGAFGFGARPRPRTVGIEIRASSL